MSFYTTVEGDDQVRATLARIDDTIDPVLGIALEEAADRVVQDAKALCPVDTGSLRASIRKEPMAAESKDAWHITVVAGGIAVNPKTGRVVDYAPYVEYGTSRMRPQPFLKPAAIQNLAAIEAIVRASLERAFESAQVNPGG